MKLALTVLTALAMVGGASAQVVLSANWEIAGGDIATFPNAGGLVRDIAYNPTTDHVLVPSRAAGSTTAASLEIIDAATGNDLGAMDTTGLAASSSGLFKIHQVEVADDGAVYACSLDTGPGGDGTNWSCFRWANEGAGWTIAIESTTTTNRTGDSFAVAGSGTGTVIYASGTFNTNIEVFTTADGVTFTDGTDVALPDDITANVGLDALPGGGFVGNSGTGTGGEPVEELSAAGATLNSIPGTRIPVESSGVTVAQFGGETFLATFAELATAEARATRITGGFAAAEPYAITPASFEGGIAGAFGVGEAVFDTTRGALVAVFPNNTIGSYGLNLPVELGVFTTE